MNNPEYWKNDSSYYASPKGSERALAFQEALNQAGGNPFTFRGLPYAGEQPQRGLLDPPLGGWTGGIDPNDFINNPKPIVQQKDLANLMGNSIPSSLSGPNFEGDDSDYFAQNYFRDFPIGLDGTPVYAGPLELPSSEGKGAKFDMDGNLIVQNNAGESIPHPAQMYANVQLPDKGFGDGGTSGYSIGEYIPTGSYAQGLLSGTIDPTVTTIPRLPGIKMNETLADAGSIPKSGATDVFGYSQFGNHPSISRNPASIRPEQNSLLSNATGYDKDPTFSNRNNLNDEYRENMFAKAMMNLSNNILAPDPFYSN